MATVNLVFDKINAQIGIVTLDASVLETHTGVNEVTDHPVEEGTNIVDHVRSKPDELRIEGLIVNTPFSATSEARPVTIGNVTFLSKSQADKTRAGQAYKDLIDAKENATLLKVVTSLRTYEDMVIERLEVPRDARNGNALKFTATLKHVRTAVLQTAKVIPSTKISKGKVAPKTAKPEQETSILFDVKEAFGKFFGGGQ